MEVSRKDLALHEPPKEVFGEIRSNPPPRIDGVAVHKSWEATPRSAPCASLSFSV